MDIHIVDRLPSQPYSTLIIAFGKEALGSLRQNADFDSLSQFIDDHLKESNDCFTTILPTRGFSLFLYLDEQKPMQDFTKSIRTHLLKNKAFLTEHLTVEFIGDLNPNSLLPSVIMAAILSTNKLGLFKEGKNGGTKLTSLGIFDIKGHLTESSASEAILAYSNLAEVQLNLMKLVNTPANHKTPAMIARQVQASAAHWGYDCKVFDRNEIIRHNMSALLSVSEGSQEEPYFLTLEYNKKASNRKSIGLVGKGVTFDTGGISVKGSSNMYMMKSDMAGAALVLSFVELCARLKSDIHVVAAIPLTENCIDGNSTKPGDVIQSYAGKSIEVIDTDAEGRLILADALAYITDQYQLDHLIDFATLTGSVIQALGFHAAGLFSNDDVLADQLYHSGMESSDRCWRMPAWDLYQEEMNSEIADIKNLSSRPVAGSITAAMFLSEFINDHPSWAHVDIAGMAYTDNEYGQSRSASGYGMRLLYDFVIKNCLKY